MSYVVWTCSLLYL